MNITILCVGQIKEKYFRDAIAEYQKRLSRYCKLQMIEVADEKTKENASEAENDLIRKKEGERLLKHIKDSDYCITLEIDGSIGLDIAVLKRSDYALSFSKMTFPHQLMRVILLEQIYRSYRIMRGEPYHK